MIFVNLQYIFFQYLQDSTHYHERKTHQQDLALAEMKRYREIVVKELSDTKMKLHRICAENKQLRHDLEWKPENPPPPPPPPPPASLLRYLYYTQTQQFFIRYIFWQDLTFLKDSIAFVYRFQGLQSRCSNKSYVLIRSTEVCEQRPQNLLKMLKFVKNYLHIYVKPTHLIVQQAYSYDFA